MAKSDTLFMTKTAKKTIPFGAAHTYIAHIREYPPGAEAITVQKVIKQRHEYRHATVPQTPDGES